MLILVCIISSRFSYKMEVTPPETLKNPLVVPQKLLMGPGPSNTPPRVLHALSQHTLGHLHLETTQIMDEVKEGIRYVFQTRNELTLAVSTAGHGAMEAVLCNLLEDGDVALVAVNGVWGERASDMAKRYGATVLTMHTEPGNNFTMKEFDVAIQKYRPKLLFVTEGESSTGVYQPVESLGDICHRYGCLLAVDAVASLGGVPMYMDKWGIDVMYTGSQKVLGAPPGLTPISFSSRAQDEIFNRKTAVKVFYWDMTVLGHYWNCFGKPRVYHHTISTPLLYGLREALAMAAEEGMKNVVKRHEKCAQRLYEGLKTLGLNLYVADPAKRLPTVTAVKVPDGVFWKDVTDYAMSRYFVEISGGLGPTAGKIFRIGLMGYNATEKNVDIVLDVLEKSLKFCGKGKVSKL